MILAELDQKIRAFLEIQICPNLSIFRNWGTQKNLDFFLIIIKTTTLPKFIKIGEGGVPSLCWFEKY